MEEDFFKKKKKVPYDRTALCNEPGEVGNVTVALESGVSERRKEKLHLRGKRVHSKMLS